MRRVILDLGWLNRMIHMKFTITVKTNTEKVAIRKFDLNGDQYLRVAPYPNFVLEIKEPIEKQQIWTSNKGNRVENNTINMTNSNFNMSSFNQVYREYI